MIGGVAEQTKQSKQGGTKTQDASTAVYTPKYLFPKNSSASKYISCYFTGQRTSEVYESCNSFTFHRAVAPARRLSIHIL